MELTSILRALLRRWWLTVPLLAATAGAASLAWDSAEAVYTTELAVLLEAGDADGDDGVPTVSGTLVEVLLEADQVRQEVAGGDEVDYDVTAAADPAGTLIAVDVTASTDVRALEVANALLGRLPGLVGGQEDVLGVPEHARTTFQPLAAPLRAEEIPPPDPVDPEAPPLPPTYRAHGVTLLQHHSEAAAGLPPNTSTIRHLAALMTTPETLAILQPHESVEVVTTFDPRDSVPLFLLQVEATTREAAADALGRAVATASGLLDGLQARQGVPEAGRTVAVPLAAPPEPVENRPRVDRAVVGVAGLGLLATVSLAVAVDGLLLDRARRRRRRDAAAAAASESADPGVPEDSWPTPTSVRLEPSRVSVSTK
ncbi:hypothetical protein [Euzebya rosea]|uniref:hypothetical protein n=1 Tax=Euzebya rosea TaxID=2052804 RepID=UPI000D3E0AC2|nr:hypothetical protein [Euzebya rosea]